jgi:phosphoglycolate phosphatase-like HAD superfamily hydrolase
LRHYLDAYAEAHTGYTEPFPGIPRLLTVLNKRKIRLGIVSGKGPGSMAISLQYSGLEKYFEVVQTGLLPGRLPISEISLMILRPPGKPARRRLAPSGPRRRTGSG